MQIRCIVKARSRMDSVSLHADNSLKVKIKAAPVNGNANEYLVKYLAGIFNLPSGSIRIVSGFTSSHKRVNIVAEGAFVRRVLAGLGKVPS